MRYFVPDIRVAQENPNCTERLGGVPWGLPERLWPRCKNCSGPQSLLAQFSHSYGRLDLGREGRVLFVFQCNCDPGMCDTWEAFSGANACFVLEPEQLQTGDTPSPTDDPPLDNAVVIVGWIERDDGLPSDLISHFRNDAEHLALPEEIHAKVTWGTRVGGFPKWMQSAEEAPDQSWEFLAQLDSNYSFQVPPASMHKWIEADPNRFEGRTHIGQGPNFGFGLGYIFIKRAVPGVPEGCFFWQR